MSELKSDLPPLRSHTTDCMNGRTPAEGSAVARYIAAVAQEENNATAELSTRDETTV